MLLYSNDKNYDIKRPIINKLTYAFDSKNREYLTKLKFNFNSDNTNNSYIDNKSNDNQTMNENQNQKLSQNYYYFREPSLIRNNEKIMLDFFKKKSKAIDKLPYLSRSTNDLINYNYKRDKDKSDIINNWMTSKNNYLNIIPKIKITNSKRKPLLLKRNYTHDKSGIKMVSSFSVKNIDEKNNKSIIDKENKTLGITEIDNTKNSNSFEIMNDSIPQNDSNEENKKIYKEKYDKLNELSNKQVLNKIRNSIEIPSIDFKKGMFPYYIERKRENKIDFLFGRHSPEIK